VAVAAEFTHLQRLRLVEMVAVAMARLQIPRRQLALQILAVAVAAEWSIRRIDPARLVGRVL
jgi:hypothetical protein